MRILTNCENYEIHELTENELDLLKKLLIAMDGMDAVTISDLFVSIIESIGIIST